ncbi:MAG: alpha/beta hydrolase [Armatimonadetes bacterium]|nr:alpha/beta hydrolase [Armatimonadota bacterium]
MTGASGAVAAMSAVVPSEARSQVPVSPASAVKTSDGTTGSFVVAKDGAQIFYKDWGIGVPVVFAHGWPLNSDAWEDQMYFLAAKGFRCIAHDRRGHGRSTQTWGGNDMDTYADDLSTLMEKLDLKGAVLIGHSTGGGEVSHYVGRYGTKRVSKVVLVDAVTPGLVNPGGVPIKAFDDIRTAILADRAKFFKEFSIPFFGANRPGSNVSQEVLGTFWRQCMTTGMPAAYQCVKAFSETDFSEDLKRFDVPTLIVHGNDDQIVPFDLTAVPASKLIKDAVLKVYAGAPHGLPVTHKDQLNKDILDFIKS